MLHKDKLPTFTVMKDNAPTCKSLETGTKIFAVINLILSTVATCISIAVLIYWVTGFVLAIEASREPTDSDGALFALLYLQGAGMIFGLMASMIAFMFAVFLTNGVFKSKPEHMKAYFVYGVMVIVLSLLGNLGYLMVTAGEDLSTVSAIFTICFLYTLILSMIRKTYQRMDASIQQFNHKLLIESTKFP